MGLALAAQRAGYEVHVAAVQDDSDSVDQIKEAGFSFHPFSLSRRGLNPFSTLHSLDRLLRIVRQVQPTLVHSLTIKSIVLSGIVCRMLGIPLIALIAGRGTSFDSSSLTRQIAKSLCHIALDAPLTRVCFQNPEDQAFFYEKGIVKKEQMHFIPGSGVDMEAFPFAPYDIEKESGQRVIALASRMLKPKGILDFMRAAPEVRKHYPGVTFRLIGAPDPGNPHSFTEKELSELCDYYSIEYCGFCQDIREKLQEVDIFCLPTRYGEGIPMTLMQAASLGKPVVCTDVPGCREVIRHEETGLLVEVDDADAVASALCRLLADPHWCAQLAKAAEKHISQHFEAHLIHLQYLQLYQEVLSQKAFDIPHVIEKLD